MTDKVNETRNAAQPTLRERTAAGLEGFESKRGRMVKRILGSGGKLMVPKKECRK